MLPPATRLSGPRIDSQPGLPKGGFASRSRAVAGPLASVPREGPWRSVVRGRVQGSSHTAGRPFRHLGSGRWRVVPGVICCWFFDVAVPVYLLHLEMRGILCFISAQGEQPRSCDSGSFCPVLWASPLDAMGGCAHGGRQNKVMRHLKSPLSELPSVRVFAKTLCFL